MDSQPDMPSVMGGDAQMDKKDDKIRKYQATHAFLTFNVDLARALPVFWLNLGEAQSKSRHMANVAMRRDTAEELMQIYLAKGVNATTAIEGNSLTEEQVRRRLEGKLELPPSKEYLGIEVDNMIEAHQQVIAECGRGRLAPLSVELIKDVNRTVLKNLELEDHVVPGEARKVSVVAGTYLGPPAEDCDYLLDRLCTWLNDPAFHGPADQRIAYGFIRAALAHLYLAWIHPFGDGNGRTARLVEFRLLVESGVPVPGAFLLSNHYNDTRSAYYRELNNASKSGGDVLPFLRYAAQGWVDNLREQLENVHKQQRDLAWRDYVSQVIKRSGQAHELVDRQRTLVAALTATGPQSKAQIAQLTPALAVAYATKTEKAVSRDLNKLKELGLVEVLPDRRWQASDWQMYAFLPPQVHLDD